MHTVIIKTRYYKYIIKYSYVEVNRIYCDIDDNGYYNEFRFFNEHNLPIELPYYIAYKSARRHDTLMHRNGVIGCYVQKEFIWID